jgi:ABC-type sugar transport system permease subunit
MTWIKLCAEELRMLGATINNSVAQVIWLSGFVHWLNAPFCKKLVICFFFSKCWSIVGFCMPIFIEHIQIILSE